MIYVTAKKFGRKGSVAYPFDTTDIGYVLELERTYRKDGIQIVGVSNFDVYGEYKPVTHVTDKETFESLIKDMAKQKTNV